jgi:hypothetical protein
MLVSNDITGCLMQLRYSLQNTISTSVALAHFQYSYFLYNKFKLCYKLKFPSLSMFHSDRRKGKGKDAGTEYGYSIKAVGKLKQINRSEYSSNSKSFNQLFISLNSFLCLYIKAYYCIGRRLKRHSETLPWL